MKKPVIQKEPVPAGKMILYKKQPLWYHFDWKLPPVRRHFPVG